jgi:hypothetical protein
MERLIAALYPRAQSLKGCSFIGMLCMLNQEIFNDHDECEATGVLKSEEGQDKV